MGCLNLRQIRLLMVPPKLRIGKTEFLLGEVYKLFFGDRLIQPYQPNQKQVSIKVYKLFFGDRLIQHRSIGIFIRIIAVLAQNFTCFRIDNGYRTRLVFIFGKKLA